MDSNLISIGLPVAVSFKKGRSPDREGFPGPTATGVIPAALFFGQTCVARRTAHSEYSSANLDQRITLLKRPRHFGGGQWYFVCPATNRCVSVLWKPPGAMTFSSRHTWGRQVAYHSQFLSPSDRIWNAKAKINRRLCELGGYNPEDWEFPPKPKWMRLQTYERYEERFDSQEEKLDAEMNQALSRLMQVWRGKKAFPSTGS
jgi:hypothetical protein